MYHCNGTWCWVFRVVEFSGIYDFIFYSLLLNFSLVFFNVPLSCVYVRHLRYIPNPHCSEALAKFNYHYVLIFSYLLVYHDFVVLLGVCVCVFVCICLELYNVVDRFAVLTFVILTTWLNLQVKAAYFCDYIGMYVVNIVIRYLVL